MRFPWSQFHLPQLFKTNLLINHNIATGVRVWWCRLSAKMTDRTSLAVCSVMLPSLSLPKLERKKTRTKSNVFALLLNASILASVENIQQTRQKSSSVVWGFFWVTGPYTYGSLIIKECHVTVLWKHSIVMLYKTWVFKRCRDSLFRVPFWSTLNCMYE